jgi:hypothetical protein
MSVTNTAFAGRNVDRTGLTLTTMTGTGFAQPVTDKLFSTRVRRIDYVVRGEKPLCGAHQHLV